jgi:heptosyltransferase-2
LSDSNPQILQVFFTFVLKSVKNILIIQTAFIGDVILALPLAQRLKQAFPKAMIHFLIRKGNESLLEKHPAIDQLWIWDKKTHKSLHLWQLIQALRTIEFDLVINCQRFFSTGLLTAMMKTTERRGFQENPWAFTYTFKTPHTKSKIGVTPYLHEVDRNLQLLQGICSVTTERPQLHIMPGHRKKIAHYVGSYVVLAPASVWFTKQWPAERWQELVSRIPEYINCLIIGATGDAHMAQQIINYAGRGENLCGKLTLMESAALMENAIRVISNDSAPLHLASAVNAPVTGIFCSTIPAFGFFPLSDDSIMLESQQPLKCRPCGLHGKKSCPEGHFKCGYNINAQMVMDTIKFLAHKNPQSTTESL